MLQTGCPHPREVFRRGGGGGGWDPKVCVPKMTRSGFPDGNFGFFPRWSLWSGGGGSRGRGGTPPLLLQWCTAILISPGPTPSPGHQRGQESPAGCASPVAIPMPLHALPTAMAMYTGDGENWLAPGGGHGCRLKEGGGFGKWTPVTGPMYGPRCLLCSAFFFLLWYPLSDV